MRARLVMRMLAAALWVLANQTPGVIAVHCEVFIETIDGRDLRLSKTVINGRIARG